MIVSLIVAMDEEGGIGKNNQLPWHLPSDLRRFKEITMGHHLVMGRKTYETIGKPLKGRVMIIVTHRRDYHPQDCLVVNSIQEAVDLAKNNDEDEVFIIGGGEIFKQSLEIADRIYLTQVVTSVEVDVFFPPIELSMWNVIKSEITPSTDKDEYRSEFKILSRKDEK